MEKNNTKLFLEVDASQIDVKQLLKKDFLELSMKAISSANPNRNNSWFTKESMEASLDSFINKPILGYFENGDFVSHNGDWNYDSETEMDYWDTLGKKGERILGIIRESDEVKIIEDKDGLSWVTFTCALWTQYSFKQVKRLIKDAKRAQKTGESTKNISVEVDITDYDMLDNGVMKINAFNLVGVTILGTRNGVKVEPGIENAELSVVDIMGREVYSAQEKTLRLAYEKLNNSVEKKEESHVENEQIINNDIQATLPAEETIEQLEQNPTVNNEDGDVCPTCGKNPCECAQTSAEKCADEQCETQEQEDCGENSNEQLNASDGNITEDDQTDNNQEPVKESCDCGECVEENTPDPIHDIAWLISDCSWNIESLNCSVKYYSEHDVEYKDYIVAVLNRILARQVESEKELAALLAKIATGVTEDDVNYEAKLEKYADVNNLIQEYEAVVNTANDLEVKLNDAKTKIAAYEHEEFMIKASALIKSAKLDEVTSAQFTEACQKSEINTLDDLKIKVAVAAFDAKETTDTVAPVFNTAVLNPDTTSVFEDCAKSNKAKKGDPWSTLHDYIGK